MAADRAGTANRRDQRHRRLHGSRGRAHDWIEEYCVRDANAWEKTTTLYAAWKAWAEKSGEYVGSIKRFSQALEKRGNEGIVYKRDKQRGRGFRGLQLIGDAGFRD